MELRTARSHYNTFYMILLGIIIGILVGAWMGSINWYAILILSAPMLLPYIFYRIILSIDIVDEQLVLKSMNFFSKRTTIFSIKEVELQLYHIPPVGRRKGFYSMYIIKEGKVLHRIDHDVAELAVFIERFNRKKTTV
ncbi:hypothetical protein [Chitinophaga sp. CF418]|uniref:hypothetical protein n=1 Tax=Chitinophaga sp. CF418 TaxID=1855287 RepID=UPI0009211C1B|nr:hypothetical protein [Chitinophaga sp. CF418]SHN29439.1 hypothetical protein SAMN05216311_108203 [Chitinophaga sp. CF418]